MFMIKVKKFGVCAYLCLDSVEEYVQGDANLHNRNSANPEDGIETPILAFI